MAICDNPACRAPVDVSDQFCGTCGTAVGTAASAAFGAGEGQAGPAGARACRGCGAALASGAVVCSSCGMDAPPAPDGPGAGGAHQAGVGAPPAPRTIPGTDIVLALGETVWRAYQATQLRAFRQGLGMLYLTDSRLIFHARTSARGRHSQLVLETRVKRVTGLRTYVTNRISRVAVLLAALLIIAGVIGLTYTGGSVTGASVVVLLVGVAIGAAALAGIGSGGTVTVQVYSEQDTTSPVSFGNAWADTPGLVRSLVRRVSGPFGILTSLLGAHDAFDFLLGIPGPDALRIASELGAIVSDLQTKGTLAQTHWQRHP